MLKEINSLTVFICDGLGQTAEGTVFSGYVSSDPPSSTVQSRRRSCIANVKALPANTSVRIEAVDLVYNVQSAEEYYVTIGDSRPVKKNDVVLRTSDANGQIEVKTGRNGLEDDADTLRFNYKYTGKMLNLLCSLELCCLNKNLNYHPG